MNKQPLTILWLTLATAIFFVQINYANAASHSSTHTTVCVADSSQDRAIVLGIVNTVIKASGTFDINAVADLYTPNALIADEEPPFSWNGATAGVQWVSTVEKTCKDFKLKEFKGNIRNISVYLRTDESVYVVVPVDYTGNIRGEHFEEDGAFTFVFRLVSGRWLIKSQVWVARKGL